MNTDTKKARFIEIHLLQSLPATPNRGEFGQPKTCVYGGCTRARVSSQCWKRAVRTHEMFAQLAATPIATRTRMIVDILKNRLELPAVKAEKIDAVLMDVIGAFLSKFSDSKEDESAKTAVALYVSEEELDAIAHSITNSWDKLADENDKGEVTPKAKAAIRALSKELVKEFEGWTGALDIALFGRMMAQAPQLSLPAAVQFAHAISTHAVEMETDFFTAVDDFAEAGAGTAMMGNIPFATATFYRYVAIDWMQLSNNLRDDDLAHGAVEAFLHTLMIAVPSGKITSTAHDCRPSLVMASVRNEGQPMSLINAFERPVRATARMGLIAPSAQRLLEYWDGHTAMWGQSPDTFLLAGPEVGEVSDVENDITQVTNVTDLVERILRYL